jgi:hypothetical protein
VKMSSLASVLVASRLEAKAIFVPSGDQAGSKSSNGLLVRLVCPDPSAFITKISSSPVRLLTKAIFEPSGDQAGWPSSAAFVVRRTRGDRPLSSPESVTT